MSIRSHYQKTGSLSKFFAAWPVLFVLWFFFAAVPHAFSFFQSDVQWHPEGKKIARLTEVNPGEHPEIMKKLVNLPYVQSKTIFPEKKGLGQGGFPLAVTDIPDSDLKAGLFIRDPDTRHGFIFHADMTRSSPFELTGEAPQYIQSLSFPTANILMVSGNLPAEKGIFRKGLFQYDWQSKKLFTILSRDLFYNPASYCFDKSSGLTIFHEGRKWISINIERPRNTVMVYFSATHPFGTELFRMSYDTGAVKKVYPADQKTFYFLTERDFLLLNTSRRLWKLSLP